MATISAEDRARAMALAVERAKAKRERAGETFEGFLGRVRIKDAITEAIVPLEPWPYLMERARAWGAGESEVVLKARQMGFSWLAAAYVAYVARRPHTKVLLISAGERESWELLEKVKIVCQQAHIRLTRSTAGSIKVARGGEVMALPSTENAGRGFTGSLVIVDEAAFHPWAAQNAAAYMPVVADGGQLLVFSTSNGAAGWFYDLCTSGDDEMDMAKVFVPWQARPGRDEEWERRTRARLGPMVFKQEYPATEEDAFARAEGLVFPQFDPERHVREEDPVPWEECIYRYAGYDLGGGDPTAAVVAGVWKDAEGTHRLHIYDMLYKTTGAPTVEELFGYLGPWHERGAFIEVACDPAPGGETVRMSLAAMGLPTQRANNNRGEGLNTVALWLDNGWLTMNKAKTQQLQREYRSYRWHTRVDPNSKDRYRTSTPFDHHGDAQDAQRYVVMAVNRDVWNTTDDPDPLVAYAGTRW